MKNRRNSIAFWVGVAVFLAAVLSMTQIVRNEYPFFAGYVILQFIALAVAWSILGGYAGYVNFGTNAFFGVGVYTAVALFKATGAPLVAQIGARCRHRHAARLWRWPAHITHARHLLLDRDDCAGDHHRDRRDELAVRRRRGRHPAAAAPGDGAVRQLCENAVLRAGGPGGHCGFDLALHPELPDRPRPAGAAGRRTRRRMHGRADAEAETGRLHDLGRADLRGRVRRPRCTCNMPIHPRRSI